MQGCARSGPDHQVESIFLDFLAFPKHNSYLTGSKKMAKPFTFHFSHGAHDTPRVMLIVDFQTQGQICGYEEIQRFFHGIPFHSLNILRFMCFVVESSALVGFACTNCGEKIDAAMATQGAVTYGFADGSGTVQAHFQCVEGLPRGLVYTLDGARKLDPQSLPPWTAGKQRPVEDYVDGLDEELVAENLGRVFSLKGLWRSMFEEHARSGETLMERAAKGCWIFVGADEHEVDEMVQDSGDEDFDRLYRCGELSLHTLDEAPESVLISGGEGPTHGNYRQWLQGEAIEAIEEGRCVGEVYMRSSEALEAVDAAFRLARLEFVVNDSTEGVFVTQITTPRGAVLEAGVELCDVLRLAAHTGITPGEAGRMVAEEVVAELLGIDL